MVGAIMEASKIAESYSLTGYRQSTSTINKIKKLRFKAQQSRKLRCKDEVTPMSQTKNDSKRETFFANY